MTGKILVDELEGYLQGTIKWPPLDEQRELSCRILAKAADNYTNYGVEPDWAELWAYVPPDCVRALGRAFRVCPWPGPFSIHFLTVGNQVHWAKQAGLLAEKQRPWPPLRRKTSKFGTRLIREARKRRWLK